ncbi:DUF1177 domain-containing protein [Bifidobacterium sp. SO4]|uniref:DUF1177 domain-containing protein n=1 Tax=Bifidobacterium sp. SO4 TaxID=2809030 RepID=UPI001BDBC6BE|nr:DUF1177 domain-containing protein [Bifidobacterium sp. SO4]MBT1170576.1 DUF1177 domain-containing protein [Bifidobacterium sp. SO4]
MLLRQMLEIYDLLDTPQANGDAVASLLRERGADDVTLHTISTDRGSTDCIKIIIPGRTGKTVGGGSPTLGIVGRLGGIGARPGLIGQVSDGDGALAALTVALKLAEMHRNGDVLDGDVIIGTHVCPDAPTIPHEPVPFMDSPIDMATMNEQEVDERMDAVLSIDTTKGNRIINVNGFAISPTVLKGAILPVSNDVLDIMTRTTGHMPQVFALSQQDITPYGNDLYHLNSILQPATATPAPVIGVAITVEQVVAGCATGATHGMDVEETARFAVEVAKSFTAGHCSFYDEDEYQRLISLYGGFERFQTPGNAD